MDAYGRFAEADRRFMEAYESITHAYRRFTEAYRSFAEAYRGCTSPIGAAEEATRGPPPLHTRTDTPDSSDRNLVFRSCICYALAALTLCIR